MADRRFPSLTPVVTSLGTVLKKWGKPRTGWNTASLLADLERTVKAAVPATLIDRDGELRHSWEDAKAMITTVWNLGAPRTTAVRSYLLDPDDYCTAAPALPNFEALPNTTVAMTAPTGS
jgi:hypothetical protein